MISEFSGDFLQWLRGFYHTAQSGSASRAAEIMHRTPAAMSNMLKSLEEELDIKLFVGKKGKKELSEEGKTLYAQAGKIFGLVEEMKAGIKSPWLSVPGTICIGSFLRSWNTT